MKKISMMALLPLFSVCVSLNGMEDGIAQNNSKEEAHDVQEEQGAIDLENLLEMQAEILRDANMEDPSKNLLNLLINNADVPSRRLEHCGGVNSICYNPHRDNELASGASKVYIWDTGTDTITKTLTGHEKEVSCVCYNPHRDNELSSASYDGTVRVWDIRAGETTQTYEHNGFWKKSSDCKYPSLDDFSYVRRTGEEFIWNSDGKSEKILKCHYPIYSVCYDPHHENELASGSGDGTVHIWDRRNGKLIKFLIGHRGKTESVQIPASDDYYTIYTTASVYSVCYNPHRRNELASGASDKRVHIWNRRDGSTKKSLGHNGYGVNSVCYNPHRDGELASGASDKKVRIWNTLNLTRKILSGHEGLFFSNGLVNSVCYNRDNELASGSRDKTVRIWRDACNGKARVLRIDEGSVESVCYNPHNPDELASGSGNGTVHIWDLSKMRAIQKWFDEGCKTKEGIYRFTFTDESGQQHRKLVNLILFRRLLNKITEAHEKKRPLTLSEEDKAYVNLMPEEVKETVMVVLEELKAKSENKGCIIL